MSTASQAAQNIIFPKSHSYPPIWTIQRVLATRHDQFKHWSSIIQFYCRSIRCWRLNITDQLSSPLFHNAKLKKWLTLEEVRMIVEWMVSEEGGQRAEWVGDGSAHANRSIAWIYWRRPEEWAEVILEWIEETGQKGSVVTLYEITQGEATVGQDFHGMDHDLLQKTLQVLVKRGKAQIFGTSGEQGVKFF